MEVQNEGQENQQGYEDQEIQYVNEDHEVEQELEDQDIQHVNECHRIIEHTPDPTLPSTSDNIPGDADDMYYQPSSKADSQSSDEILIEVNSQTNESPFKKFLFWPKEEVKVNRKSKEKSRSVITSDYWLHEQQKKEELKLEKERLKENRKRAREEKQKEKLEKSKQPKKCKKGEGKGKNKAPGKIGQDKKADWKCFKCNTAWKEMHYLERKTKWLSCINCPNKVHKVCVPIKYINSLGIAASDSEDEIQFVCEKCGITIDSSDTEESWDDEEEEY